jgi:hypothetical protein
MRRRDLGIGIVVGAALADCVSLPSGVQPLLSCAAKLRIMLQGLRQ